jgi:hypothetical protein
MLIILYFLIKNCFFLFFSLILKLQNQLKFNISMKKSTLLFAALISGSLGFAQSQRLCMAEGFSNASCGPCASQNPAYNTLIGNNTTKVVSIKYQTNWPGVDPMNAQTQSEVAPRVSYYGVTGVPWGALDGTAHTGSSYSGALANLNQTKIDTRYAISSPFSMTVTHTPTSDYDSVSVTVTVTASQAFSASGSNTLTLHTALVEKEIKFDTPPGTNGETVFHSVMRKMLPNASGTSLATTWTNGQSFSITFDVPIPNYIYDLNQLAVVAFVQESGTKEIHQAGYSAPQPLALDGGVTAISNIPLLTCNTSFTPSYTIKNFGTTTLTSATINYQVDNGTISNVPWTGSLATNGTQVVTLPTITSTPGSHTLKVWTSNPNGSTDYNTGNDQKTAKFNILGAGINTPVVETFQATTFPPTNWILNNPDAGPTWTRVTNAGSQSSTASTRMYFYASPSNQIDDLFMPMLNMTSATSPMTLKFDVAYASYAGEADQLQVNVSTDCGQTWNTVFDKAGATLATAPNTTSSFVPTAAQWRAESVNLSSFIGQGQVLIQFRGISKYGNNLFLDNINVQSTTSVIEEEKVASINIFPNPFNNNATIAFTNPENQEVQITLYNALGQAVNVINKGKIAAGDYTEKIDGTHLPAGVYFVNITAGETSITKKVTLTK